MKDTSPKISEIFRYLVVGVLTTVVSLGSYYLCVAIFLDPADAWQLQLANIISWVCAVAFAYSANRTFVFFSRDPHVLREAARFALSRLTTLLMDMGLMFVGVTLLHQNDKVIKILVQIVVMAANYLFSKLLVFTKKSRNMDR